MCITDSARYAAWEATGTFTMAEGGIASPEAAEAARASGADAVVVGTAITNVDVLVQRYARAIRRKSSSDCEGFA